MFIVPAADQAPLEGSYRSAVPPVSPPVTRTVPSDSNVAVYPVRAWRRLPVAVQVPAEGE